MSSAGEPAVFGECVDWQGELPVCLAIRAVGDVELRRAERLLADIAVAEQPRSAREGEDDDRLRRLEAKVDLMALLLARHLGPVPGFRPALVRLSARGAAVPADAGPVEATALGLLLADWLPDPLWLAGRVVATREGRYTFAFDDLPLRLADQVQGLVFRWHRRALAESRRSSA